MPTVREIKSQTDQVVETLIECSLAVDQNFPFERQVRNDYYEISFKGAEYISKALKDDSYSEIYRNLAQQRAYLCKMIDGALVQMTYAFREGELKQHRLAFFPSPDLEEFQNNPDIYLLDELYGDILAKNIVPFPFRFDFNANREAEPKSHLTLGQYKNCRIPVSAPLTPIDYIEFLLCNFYHTAHDNYADKLPRRTYAFDKCITDLEETGAHVRLAT